MRASLGFLNHRLPSALAHNNSAGAEYRRRPGRFQQAPFPWLGWLDRPFANKLELLNVPKTSAPALVMNSRLAGTSFTPYSLNNARVQSLC